MKHGIPFDVAFALDSRKRTAWSIIFSEQDTNSRYNFHTREFEANK